VNELLLEGKRTGTRYSIVIVSEGAKPQGGSEVLAGDEVDSFGHKTLGGVGEFIAQQVKKGLGLDTRSVVLSHLQRGGAPSAFDRRMGRYFGIAAVDLVVQRDFGKLVSFTNGRVKAVPIEIVGRYNGRRTILGGVKEAV